MTRVDTFPDPVLKKWPITGRVIVLDLEYTSWEGSIQRNWSGDWEFREIIEIGALRLYAFKHEFRAGGTFERLVKPVRNPKLSRHISHLTGITNSMISEKSYGFKQALADLCVFVQNHTKIWCVGSDGEVLRENCYLNQIPYPFQKNQVMNIRPALSKILNKPENQIISGALPEIAGLPLSGKKHSALSDTMSIYMAINHLRKKKLL